MPHPSQSTRLPPCAPVRLCHTASSPEDQPSALPGWISPVSSARGAPSCLDQSRMSTATDASAAARVSGLPKPFDVVLERPRQGLVEVVHVEQQPPLGRGEHPEVRQMRIPAQLHVQAGGGGVLEVGGHDLGAAPVEGERRHQHPAVADRDQVRLPGAVLLLEQPDRVGAITGRGPAGVAGGRGAVACLPAPGPALVNAWMRDLRPGGHQPQSLRASFRWPPSVPSAWHPGITRLG
jgi:hypothetical protein